MYDRSANLALLKKVEPNCLFFDLHGKRNSAVVINKMFAATCLHVFPEEAKVLGYNVVLCDGVGEGGKKHDMEVYAIHRHSDYIVLKRKNGEFESAPTITRGCILDEYLAVGFPFGEQRLAVRLGHVSSISEDGSGYLYGTSGGLPGFSGSGVFFVKTGSLMGIARGNRWRGKQTEDYGNVLEMISVQFVLHDLDSHGKPFSL